jgi:hypothetical protein
MEMFTVKNGARPGQRNLFILFTSGKSTGTQPLQPAVKQLQGMGVSIYVVGTSDNVDRDEVTAVAPGNDDGVYLVDDASRIAGVVPKVIMKVLNRDSIGKAKLSSPWLSLFWFFFVFLIIFIFRI